MDQNHMTHKLYLIIILLIISTASQAAPAVQLSPGIGKYELGLYADVLEDNLGELTLGQVSSENYAEKWSQNPQAIPNFAFS